MLPIANTNVANCACARPRKPPSRSIALRRLASVAAHRPGRQAVRRAPLVRHPSGTTARRTRKPPEAVHENACVAGVTKWRGRQKFLGRNHLRQGCSGQEDCKGMTLFEPALFASPAERAVSCGPKGPFVSGGAAWPDRAQGRCNADGEAKPQAVRRRAFIEVAARRPAARRFSWLRASASLPRAQAPAALGGGAALPPGVARCYPPTSTLQPPGVFRPRPPGVFNQGAATDSA